MKLVPKLQSLLNQNNIDITTDAVAKLVQYVLLLQKWNRVHNLTAIKDPEEMLTKHILDSLAIMPYLHGNNILDVGTGAGLPGVPLATTNPGKHFTLLDKQSKKTNFLTFVKTELSLANVEIVKNRIESYKSDTPFDIITSRAFAKIQDILIHTKPLLAEHGKLLLLKGQYPHAELKDLEGQLKIERLDIKGLGAERHLVIIG